MSVEHPVVAVPTTTGETAPARVLRRGGGWVGPVAIAAGATIVGGVYFYSFYVALATAVLFVVGALTYGITAMVVIGARWNTIPAGATPAEREDAGADDIRSFRTLPQRATLTLGLVLLVTAIAAIWYTVQERGDVWSGAVLFGGVAQIAGGLLLVANALWAFPRRYIVAEDDALTRRIGRHRLILVNRVIAYAVWSVWIAIAGYIVWSTVFSPSFGTD